MKKLFTLTVILSLVLLACSQADNDNNNTKVQTITIKNESSYTLTNVKFMGLDFYVSGTKDLPVSSQANKQITSDLINKSGFISFSLKDTPGAACRTSQTITVSDEDLTFIFLDATIVEELNNSNNKRPLSQITFSRINIERNGLALVKNEIIPLGETVINYISQHEFSIKNTGVGKLKLTGNEPVKTNGSNDVFSIIQPTSSEVNPNGILTFKINFNPKAIQPYSSQITIYSDDMNGDFTFTIMAVGTVPKPIVNITYGTNDIAQNGTIDIGEVFLTQSRNISVIIKNTGTEVLTIEPENISLTGTDAAAFTQLSNPGGSISIGSQTSFSIEFKPTKQGEHNATLRIPTNDTSRNPVEIYLKGTGKKGNAILQLSQGTINIQNGSLTPVNYNNVDIGTNKSLAFTIKNNGNINLELTGETIIESSNTLFDIPTPPTKRIISPGETESFIIRYSPTVEHEDTATITILNNMDSMVFTFTVKGIGYVKRPQIVIQQNSSNVGYRSEYNYGNVGVGDNKDIIFTIKNSGDANLSFIPVSENCVGLLDNSENHFVVLQQPSSSSEVAPNGTTTFVVRFIPTAIVTNYTATVQIKTNSRTNEDFTFSVKGNGYEKKPQITIKKDNTTISQNGEYDFGTISLASGGAIEVTFTIGNSGESDLKFVTVNNNRINIVDDSTSLYSVISQPTISTEISPGNTATFTLRFKPKAVGTNFYANVQIKTNSQNNNDFSFRVKGSCVRYMIGDTGPGGGTIYYLSGNQGKECSANLGTYTWNNAVTAAKNHKGGGFTNWQLPDLYETVTMMWALEIGGIYWTSEQDTSNTNRAYSYSPGRYPDNTWNDLKTTLYNVRAIREFSF
jgi:hypothetical protein